MAFVSLALLVFALPAALAAPIDPFGCQYKASQTTCSNVAACAWTGDTCVTICQAQQELAGVCASPLCMWNLEYTVCEPACNTFSHNYDLCVTTPQCQWNDVTRLCTFDCGAIANHSVCTALPTCDWSSSARACRRSCYFRYSSQRLCNADPECMWSLPAGYCQPSCPAYDGNSVLCSSNTAACMYDVPTTQCSLGCAGTNALSACATQYVCRWIPQNATCVPLCVFAYYNPIDCNGDPHCMWDATIQACATQCQYIVTASSCIAETQCYWNGTACSRTCAAITDSTTCARNLDCMWSDLDHTCQPTCNGRLSTACMLGPEPLCHLDVADQCEPSCNGLYLSAPTCNTDTRCNWNDTTSSCEASCQALFTAGQCGSITGCSWVPTKGICMTTCSTQTNSTACSQLLECLWSTTLQICRIACDMLTDASVCNRDTQCSWDIVDTQCHASCAGRYGTQGFCLRDARCAWNSVHGVCQENCTFVGDSVRCNETSSCAWNTPTSTCVSTVNSIQIDSVQYAAQLNNSDLRPGLVIALQTDLSNAYNAQVQIVGTRISIAAALTTVPFLAPIEAPPQVIANSVGIKDGSWLKQSIKAFVANGGTQSLTVTAYIPAGTTPSTESASSSGIALHTIVLIAGCSAAALLVVSACAVWGWRHNPYAAARAPVQTTQRFTGDEYDRLKAINERVVTYEEAIMLKQRWDATQKATTANEGMNQWPVVARCEMPKNQQRKPEQRHAWDDMSTSLFPSVFEHLTQQRIAVDKQGFIRTPARNAVEVMRYTLALRLHAQGKGNIEFVMSGSARIVLVDDARRLLSVSTNIVDSTVDVFPAAREAFERSGWCSEMGSHEMRKLVFGRLRPSESFIVVATDPLPDSTPVLIGFPRDCTCAVVESAVRLMLRLATAILESRRDFSDEKLRVHRLEDTWRLNATPDVLAAIAVLSPRFWMIDQDILCCHCSVGIPIHPVVPFAHTIRTAMDVNVPIPSRNRSPSTHPNTTPSIDMSAGSSISEELETNLLRRE